MVGRFSSNWEALRRKKGGQVRSCISDCRSSCSRQRRKEGRGNWFLHRAQPGLFERKSREKKKKKRVKRGARSTVKRGLTGREGGRKGKHDPVVTPLSQKKQREPVASIPKRGDPSSAADVGRGEGKKDGGTAVNSYAQR